MKSLGYCMSELWKIPFLEFVHIQDGVKILPKDLQIMRYEEYLASKQRKIDEIRIVKFVFYILL